jgi:conserved oligomeric Golgi complex subunit 1
MATPDISTLTSASQIFAANTLPQIRAIHNALHRQIDDKAARLRTQVGGSYRELLGTADTIVRMNGDMAAVQSTLGTMGGRCGRGVVQVKVAGLSRAMSASEAHAVDSGVELSVLARVKLLGACALVVSRTLRARGHTTVDGDATGKEGKPLDKGDRLVSAARVLVLSRLLVKSLGTSADLPSSMGQVMDEAKATLGRLRGRLLHSINKVLEKASLPQKQREILRALSAYSLATSSGTRDLLRHFLHIRGDAMALAFEVEENDREREPIDVVRCMELYINTLLTVQSLVPHRLAEALMGLKKMALLADDSLREVEALRLDIYEQWCGDEIQYFTPFIRHDDLDAAQAREMLDSWASRGGDILLEGLNKTLERMTEFKAVVDLRSTVLKMWIGDGGRAKGLDSSIMLGKIREVINKHLLAMLDLKVSRLRLVGSEVAAALEAGQGGSLNAKHELWDEGIMDTDLNNGASHFAQDVISYLHGRTDAVSRALNSYNSWHRIVGEASETITHLQRLRWDTDVEDIEDEEVIEQRQVLLSKTDPQLLKSHLDAALTDAFKTLESHLGASWATQSTDVRAGQAAVILVRVLRDIRANLPRLDSVQAFGLDLVPPLHKHIVSKVTESAIDQFGSSSLRKRRVVGRSLWEGQPELPNTPSAGTFNFLRELVTSMADAGMDLWSPNAVTELRRHAAEKLNEVWLVALSQQQLEQPQKAGTSDNGLPGDAESRKSETEEGKEGLDDKGADHDDATEGKDCKAGLDRQADESAQQRKDLLIQWHFDVCYLRYSLQTSPEALGAPLAEIEGRLQTAVGPESSDYRPRLVKAAQDYWERTSLLFGLL